MAKDKYPYVYREILLNEGISETRADSICWALYDLHSAIAKLDCNNIRRFFSISLEKRIDEFAFAEKLIQLSKLYEDCVG